MGGGELPLRVEGKVASTEMHCTVFLDGVALVHCINTTLVGFGCAKCYWLLRADL